MREGGRGDRLHVPVLSSSQVPPSLAACRGEEWGQRSP